jgi:hypothetical protein
LKEFEPLPPGTNRVAPGLLTKVCSPTLVLRIRNFTGAPETSALTLIVMGKMATGWALNPGTGDHCVEVVDTGVVCQKVSMQSSGVLPPPVWAATAHALPATSATVVIATISFLILTTPSRSATRESYGPSSRLLMILFTFGMNPQEAAIV